MGIWMKYMWSGVTWDICMFQKLSFYIGGIHNFRFWMKYLWFYHMISCWSVVAISVLFFLCSLYLFGLHKLRVWMKYMWSFILACMSWYLYHQVLQSIKVMLLVVAFMSVQNISRLEFVREVEVGEVGWIGGARVIVSVEAEGPDRIFVEWDIVRNMYWLVFLVDFQIINL